MKKEMWFLPLLLLFLLPFSSCSQQETIPEYDNYTLWYRRPATNWNEALPIGNGRLGAMIFGNPGEARLQLNEETVWSGGPNNNIKPDMRKDIPVIRKLLFEKKFRKASEVAGRMMKGKPNNGMAYQPVGELLINFPGHENYNDYKRTLDISKAVATVSFEIGNVKYKREIFASFPDQVIVERLTADEPGKITCQIRMASPQKHHITTADNKLILSGISGNLENQAGRVKFSTQVKVKTSGGRRNITDSSIMIKQADTATIYVSIATNFKNYHNLSDHEAQKADHYLKAVGNKSYGSLLKDQIAAYQKYYNRVSLDLGSTDSTRNPTDIRIRDFDHDNDPQLAALLFQFGRYLLICSSQPGGQPPNLQGIWNHRMHPSWDSKYTININTEMNYWPVDVANLPKLIEPLTNLVEGLSVTGKEAAEEIYGARGWVVHHNTDIWRITGPVDGASAGLWPCGGAWLCHVLWKNYLFTGNKKYLERIYPLLKGAATYFIDELQLDPDNHWLVVTPSVSPETGYLPGDSDKKRTSVTAGATVDNLLVFDLFSAVIKSSHILNIDQSFADTLEQMRDSLPPMQIGKYSQLQEWMYDWDDTTDHNRHLSNLYGLFPGGQISPYRTPKLFEAAKNSLIYRGFGPSTGWSYAWKINLWARLLDGKNAYYFVKKLLTPASPELKKKGEGHIFPSLFDGINGYHSPFQIDANFGFTSGVSEMLLQSYDGNVFVLPALPKEWSDGSFKGLLARGGFRVNATWEKGEVRKLTIYSSLGGNCRIRTYNQLKGDNVQVKSAKRENPNLFYKFPHIKTPLISAKAHLENPKLKRTFLYDINTQPGHTYILKYSKE